ncbi:spore coat protein CotJB [Blautia sp. HCP3S3_H10_1]|uniref:spore coat protein CotJB n=1 Tax=unclassified Blautia TaxID=2648079 RepID=UPI003F8D96F1|nr:spore coat protein CotJB [Clostridia bacterium]
MSQKKSSERSCLLRQINEVSFAVNDMLLYLDTHPDDEKALKFFKEVSSRRNQLMTEYAEKYGPLTIDDAVKNNETSWKWSQQPFPWEGKGV